MSTVYGVTVGVDAQEEVALTWLHRNLLSPPPCRFAKQGSSEDQGASTVAKSITLFLLPSQLRGSSLDRKQMEPVLRVEEDALDEAEFRFILFTPRSPATNKLRRLNIRETVFMLRFLENNIIGETRGTN